MKTFFDGERSPRYVRTLGWLAVAVVLLAIILVMFAISENKGVRECICGPFEEGQFARLALVCGIATWFDPVVFQYNFLLFLFCISIIPIFTYFYTARMKEEKAQRIYNQLPDEMWKEVEETVIERIRNSMSFKNYAGSMIILNLIVIFGMAILLLLKPMQMGIDGAVGVDFGKGANFLMLGPFMTDYVAGDVVFQKWLTVSLTAFQFGFGGAFMYFLTHLVRSYFTLDLTPDSFVSSSVRMLLGSVISIVFCFALVQMDKNGDPELVFLTGTADIGWLPALSFMIGFFPERAMLYLDKAVSALVGWKTAAYESMPLSKLSGMSQAHEIRLNREGFDTVENLATADCLDLLLRTGFSYDQLNNWIGEADLRAHLRDDYAKFRRLSGLNNSHEVLAFIKGKDSSKISAAWDEVLQSESGDNSLIATKIKVISELLRKSVG